MSDNRSAELEKLFEEWQERHESENCSSENISKSNFIPDGIIDEASYMQSPKKILFIAKEAACLKKGNTIEKNFEIAQNDGFWCRRVVLGEEGGTRFSSGLALLANAILNENFETPEKDISALRYVAFMNINKRGGFTSCQTRRLAAYVKKYKDLIDREIRIISPDIIVCCGMGVRGRLSGVDSCKSLPVLEVYHPSARYKTDTDRLKKLEDELKNAQF
ncbi:MAG: hypothetical protein UDW72_08520 [Acutalibacteraceae bacterium]|jgi:hypothetical protein|nr:hypothetical protein [Acutalibacteraceae bacterium]